MTLESHVPADPKGTPMTPERLKPCPFCGSENIGRGIGKISDGRPWHYVSCRDCPAMIGNEEGDESSADKLWNRRTPDLSSIRAEAMDEMEKMIRFAADTWFESGKPIQPGLIEHILGLVRFVSEKERRGT